MNFDLHIHTTFSDGDLKPHEALEMLPSHAEFVTVTDHDNALFHNQIDTGCAFKGVEITAHIKLGGDEILTEILFYGFSESDIPQLTCGQGLPFDLELSDLVAGLQPIKDRCGAKVFLAHPYYSSRTNIAFTDILDYCGQYLDGFECLHESANEQEAIFLLDYCRKNGKLASGGSDSHYETLDTTPYLHLVDSYFELFQWIPEMARR